MQHDELIWGVLNTTHCSYKSKTLTSNFCRNRYNVTGLCNRHSCPLGNSQYATIIEREGAIYLYMKTIERSHTPAKLWEKVKLSKNLNRALEQVTAHLAFWPKWLINKNKQRLLRIRQYLIRMRRLSLKVRPKLYNVNTKIERREKTREQKALVAAQLDQAIKKEILERWKAGTYDGDIYNVSRQSFEEALDEEEIEEEEIEEEEDDADVDLVVEEEDEFVPYEEDEMEDSYNLEQEYENELENEKNLFSQFKKIPNFSNQKKGSRSKVNIEYEHENEHNSKRR